jgi:hypothetical protein
VVLKNDGLEVEVGSISIQHEAGGQYLWYWAVDSVIPMRSDQTSARGKDRADCMRQFKAAWDTFSADPPADRISGNEAQAAAMKL